ncbi:MAG: tRNA lysidine(34) synthetase TilS, partial [Armatimonadia bacterium]|nr:tRNA lysidine(34) synthetase TilS [Armatimonadia bacterium]
MPIPMPKRLNPFECRVLDTVRRRELLRSGASVLVAFSGGPDSSALLRALVALRPEMDLTVCAAHVVHGLHDHAEAHAEHCRVVARELAVALRVREVDVRGRAARERLSVEHAAREERYAALADLRAATESRYIATGHSCDDRAETVVVNLLRGTGAEGLVGVPPVRGHIVRPLIERSRTEILEYLDERGMPWVA